MISFFFLDSQDRIIDDNDPPKFVWVANINSTYCTITLRIEVNHGEESYGWGPFPCYWCN